MGRCARVPRRAPLTHTHDVSVVTRVVVKQREVFTPRHDDTTTAAAGTCLAVPLRHAVLVRERLAFPSGTATAKLIAVLHQRDVRSDGDKSLVNGERDGSVEADLAAPPPSFSLQWRVLRRACGAAAAWQLTAFLVPCAARLRVATWLGAPAATRWGWTLLPSPSYAGQGAIMGASPAAGRSKVDPAAAARSSVLRFRLRSRSSSSPRHCSLHSKLDQPNYPHSSLRRTTRVFSILSLTLEGFGLIRRKGKHAICALARNLRALFRFLLIHHHKI